MKNRKGIILAGGLATRMYPITIATSKQLLPIYDKPMIYYPLSTLMLAGIRKFLIISTKEHLNLYKQLLGKGTELGLQFFYKVQNKPSGIAESLILAKSFIKKSSIALILGDNIFTENKFELENKLKKADQSKKATIFTKEVINPSSYGVVSYKKKSIEIIEKPLKFFSNQAVVGLYFYPNSAIKYAECLNPSFRGELEITDINNIYIKKKKMNVEKLSKNVNWYDAGTHENFFFATKKIFTLTTKINNPGCIHQLALKKKFISRKTFFNNIKRFQKSSYGKYLLDYYNSNLVK
jgi:glucose-1-phosphate thymidylyltransferase